MMDALDLLRLRGIHPIKIERASERPGATGWLLDRGQWIRTGPASDATPRASNAPCDPVVEADRVAPHQSRGLRLVGGRWSGVGAHIAECDGDD